MRAFLRGLCLVLAMFAGPTVLAQVLTDQEYDYLRQLFAELIVDTLDGAVVKIDTLPVDRIQGLIPADKIIEADPVAFPVASNAFYLVGLTILRVDSLESNLVAVTLRVAGVEDRTAAMESRTSLWDQASIDASSWTNSLAYRTDFTTNFSYSVLGFSLQMSVTNGLVQGVERVQGPGGLKQEYEIISGNAFVTGTVGLARAPLLDSPVQVSLNTGQLLPEIDFSVTNQTLYITFEPETNDVFYVVYWPDPDFSWVVNNTASAAGVA